MTPNVTKRRVLHQYPAVCHGRGPGLDVAVGGLDKTRQRSSRRDRQTARIDIAIRVDQAIRRTG
jgi:hypothetical protein